MKKVPPKDAPDTNAIYPTGTCFDDALDLMVELLKAAGPVEGEMLSQRLRLVHAACVWPEDGHLYAHAWLEDIGRGVAYITGIYNGERCHFEAPAAEYTEPLQVQDLIRYSYREAFHLNRASRHYGPWVPHLRALCRARDAAMRTTQHQGD